MSVLFPSVAHSLNVRLLSAGYMDVDDWWTRTDVLRDFWRLYLNSEDGAALDLGDSVFEMPAGRIVIVPAGLPFDAVLRRPIQHLFCCFEFVGWPASAALEVIPQPLALPPSRLRDTLGRELCHELAQASELEPVISSRMKSLIHLSVADALAGISEERASRFLRIAEGQQELLTVLHYIEEHLDQPLPNARLAEVAMASESRFIRRFREATGRTPGRYVQDRRLRHAAELLVSTEYSIDEIAETCGFANRYYFTRVFAQRMGCPPARYRSSRPYLKPDDDGLNGVRSARVGADASERASA